MVLQNLKSKQKIAAFLFPISVSADWTNIQNHLFNGEKNKTSNQESATFFKSAFTVHFPLLPRAEVAARFTGFSQESTVSVQSKSYKTIQILSIFSCTYLHDDFSQYNFLLMGKMYYCLCMTLSFIVFELS